MNFVGTLQASPQQQGANALLRVACVIPTYNGCSDLQRLLTSLSKQTQRVGVLIVDSSSKDGSYELAVESGAIVVQIPGSEFNHGGTRQMMVARFPAYDIYVFLTQDAYLEDANAIERLVAHFGDAMVGAVCGRQLPHLDANLLSQHARLFNYPPTSQTKTLADVPRLGIKTAFMSNSFSAYRREALLQAGGFPVHVILSEDMYVAGKMLQAGWAIVYAGDAACRHSHNYTIGEEFRRYFDVGVFQGREGWIRDVFGGAGGEGFRFVKSELKFAGFKRIYLWPWICIRTAAKLLGYRLGQKEKLIPLSWKKKLSMYRGFWSGPYADAGVSAPVTDQADVR